MSRLPTDAFSQYLALGPKRSYEALARRLDVTKRTISRVATKEQWQQRIAKIDQQARERTDAKAAESLEAINTRHLQMLRAIQSKALQGLSALRLDDAMDCVRALELAIRQERVVLGEPGDRSAVNVEEVIRGEYERWMTREPASRTEGDDAAEP